MVAVANVYALFRLVLKMKISVLRWVMFGVYIFIKSFSFNLCQFLETYAGRKIRVVRSLSYRVTQIKL